MKKEAVFKRKIILFCCIIFMFILTGCSKGRFRTSENDFSTKEFKEAKISAENYLQENYPTQTFQVKITLSGPGNEPFKKYAINCYAIDENDNVYYGSPIGIYKNKRWYVGDEWDFSLEEYSDKEFWESLEDKSN